MKSVLLIGLGRFGWQMAEKLQELRHEVLAVDREESRVNDILPLVTNAQIGDGTNEAFIASLGVRNFDLCVVAIGDDFQSSLETTALLKEKLTALGLEVVPGQANYLLFRAAGAADLKERMLMRGVLIRSCANYHGLGNDWYRVCVGQAEQNRRLLAALKEVL